MLSATAIIFLDGTSVGSPAILEYFFVMKRPVAPVSKITVATRAWSLKPRMCGVSCVLKVCVVETVSLKCTLHTLMYRLGVV